MGGKRIQGQSAQKGFRAVHAMGVDKNVGTFKLRWSPGQLGRARLPLATIEMDQNVGIRNRVCIGTGAKQDRPTVQVIY